MNPNRENNEDYYFQDIKHIPFIDRKTSNNGRIENSSNTLEKGEGGE